MAGYATSDWKNPYAEELAETVAKMATRGKGLLAADESVGTCGKRFAQINVENTEENRRFYRSMLVTTDAEMANYLSGVIMFEETLLQKSDEGKLLPEVLKEKGILTGIKVDKGVVPLAGTDGETTTQGLDGLGKRCAEYYKQGARFAKWRAVLKISDNAPSPLAIHENAYGLARYACLCLENGLVPIVEPEVLSDGPHSIEKCAAVTERVQAACIKALIDHNVPLNLIVLKPNMVMPGADGPKVSAVEVAKFTVRTLQRTIPPAVRSILFLSGGQTEQEATVHLDQMNRLDAVKPWTITFSYGRALQSSVLKAWKGDKANKAEAQKTLLKVARANSMAGLGKFDPKEAGLGNDSLYQKNYAY